MGSPSGNTSDRGAFPSGLGGEASGDQALLLEGRAVWDHWGVMRIVFQKDDLNINSSECYCPCVFRIHQGQMSKREACPVA